MRAWAISSPLTVFFDPSAACWYCSENLACLNPRLPLILPVFRLSSTLLSPKSCLRLQSSRIRCSASASDGWPREEARDAIMEILREYGVSEEDARRITAKSPQYLDVIIRDVLELDEHSLWSSWDPEMEGGGEDVASLSFKRKVCFMVKSKGDGGLLPFLESLGVRPSSAMRIAGYLASEKLPDLINKVKFVKEVAFSSSDNGFIIGKNARRMMRHLSILADEDIQGTLSFFEKMEARHGGLSMLDNGDASFPHLIESFPRLLLLSVENHLKPLAEFLVLVGVPESSISTVLLSYPPIMFYDIEKDIKPRLDALKKAGLKEKDIGKILIKYPWVLSSSVQGNYDKVLLFFTQKKVPKSTVDLAIKSWPHLLGCSTDKMNAIMEQFGQLGVHTRRLTPVITSSPQLLLRKPDEFLEVVSFMEDFGFDEITTGRILCRCPEIFAASVDGTLQMKVKFLNGFGISRKHLPIVIRKYPELLLLDVNNTLLPRLRYLMEIGLSKKEVCSMVFRFSPLLGYSIEAVLKPKLDFLLKTMQKPLKEIVEYPRYFSYSLERKIKPRFWVLKRRNITFTLKDMLGKNDEEFAEQFMGIGRLLVPPKT
ncbi:hypothetical protein AXF42_Ash018006 [Apostasia shenzhenica]|uniref:mTERF domain-containing protein 1, mitochondrial n=1 Tax=Apostasia shenzhenica TaxID=1088818 RepID=A0A2I0A549_9ASPA|nr:hypothetical protein AXF42_Ash018006 [Apostasia shenzhenica]